MITTIIQNSKFRIQNSEFKIQNSKFRIMITIVGKIFNWKNQGLKHKSKSSMFKSQSSKDKKFKVFNAPWRGVRFK